MSACIFFLILLFSWQNLPFNIQDYQITKDRERYVEIAEGNLQNVEKPFSKRILHPKLTGWISQVSPLNLDHSFFFLSLLALFVFIFVVVSVLRSETLFPLALAIPIMVTPYLTQAFSDYYLHDLFFSMVLALFFLLFIRNHFWIGMLVLVPLFLTREATILLCLILLFFKIFQKKGRQVLGIFIVMALGVLLSHHFGSLGQPSRHGMGELTYMLSKVFFNFSENFLGLELWTNSFQSACDPVFQWRLPGWIKAGNIQQIGICELNLERRRKLTKCRKAFF